MEFRGTGNTEVKDTGEEAETSLTRLAATSVIVLNDHFFYLQGIGLLACLVKYFPQQFAEWMNIQ